MAARVSVGVIGDFDPGFPPHAATNAALRHAAQRLGVGLDVRWIDTESLAGGDVERTLVDDALWCAPGSPYRSLDGALRAVRFAREADVPFLGTCGGFQHAVLEYARNVLGFEDAQHAEYDPYASELFVTELACSLVGQRMDVRLEPTSRAARFYGGTESVEEYYCNFGLDPAHRQRLHDGGLRVVGTDRDGDVRVLELPDHRFFLATLFVPQLSSSPASPHPLITAYLRAAIGAADGPTDRVDVWWASADGDGAELARGAVRSVLGRALDLPPERVELTREEGGKPRLSDPTSELRFNVSHSGGTVLLATAHGREVGVDVERIGERRVDCLRLAERFFSPGEAGLLRELPVIERERTFFELWVAKEAHAKAVGKGLALGLGRTVVTLSGGRATGIRSLDGADETWVLSSLDLGEGYAAAVVAAGHGWAPRLLRWPEDLTPLRGPA